MRRLVLVILIVAAVVAAASKARQRKGEFIAHQVEQMASSDTRAADEARMELQRCGPSAVRPVIRLLDHHDAEVRARAVRCLANIGHAAAAGPLFEHARAGDWFAADALAVLKHPRAREALAWAPALEGTRELRDLLGRLPAGGNTLAVEPDEPRTGSPRRPSWGATNRYPPGFDDSIAWRFQLAQSRLDEALRLYPLRVALLGKARLHELCGDHEAAASVYKEVLSDHPRDAEAREGLERAERLMGLARQMEALLPPAYRVRRIFEHESWRTPEGTYCVALISYPHSDLSLATWWPKLVVFRSAGSDMAKVSAVAPVGWRGYPPSVRVGLASAKREPSPLIVVVTGMADWYYGASRMLRLYRLSGGRLEQLRSVDSYRRPTVSDMDGDGRIEVVVWTMARSEQSGYSSPPWPVVCRVEGDRLVDCGHDCTRPFACAAPVLRDWAMSQNDAKCWESAGEAYEICGKRADAVAAYSRAETGYLRAARACESGRRKRPDLARAYRQMADRVRARRDRIKLGPA
jgi:tetratricopeptide (TPR) repeat protein